MGTLIVGDVHGCAAELRQLRELAGAERVVLVGDMFTKGPDPQGVWAQIRDHGIVAVMGNHDQRLLDAIDGQRPRDRHAHECVAALDAFDPAWRSFTRGLPLYRTEAGWTVVHASLHPTGDLLKTTPAMAMRLRRWPQDQPEDARWWEVYRGERRVVFGHDARGGLVRVDREGQPWVIGLDTGCVYGGRLSAWHVEEARVIDVPAARPYYKPRKSA